MKKIISLIIAAAMLVLLVSCETKTDPTGSTTGTVSSTTSTRPVAGEPVVEGTTLKSAAGLSDSNGEYTIPDGITFIAEGAFANDEKLTKVNIPSSVTTIGSGAFYGCTSLASVSIPDSVTDIGTMAFYGCVSLEEIKLPSNLKQLLSETFNYCQALESIEIPEGVTSIGPSCFYGCISLSEITFPSTLESIGASCFYGCISLRETNNFSSTKLTVLADMIFGNCTSLSKIFIPSSVTEIGSGAFIYCSNLTDLNIPFGVTDVGMMALNFTPWYRENTDKFFIVGDGVLIKSTYNPNSADEPGTLDLSGLGIKSIGNSCFSNVSAAGYGSAYGYQYCSNIKKIVIPEGVSTVSSGAFFGCVNVEELILPSTLETIGGSAFYGYLSGSSTFSNLTVSFDNCTSLKTINDEAFFGCYGIEDVKLPASVTHIGRDAFTETTAFYNFMDGSRDAGDGNKYKIVGDNVLLWVYVAKDQTSVEVPEGVKYIAGGACSGWDSSLVYSDIENSDNSEAIKVKYRITYNLTSVSIPEGVIDIGDYAFYRMIAVTSLTIPDSVENIDTAAFFQCGSVTGIKLSKNIKHLGSGAFAQTAIQSITLPDGLEVVDSGAFSQCDALERLVIPKSVKSIGASVIDEECTSFSSLYISPEFRLQVFTIVDVQNPNITIYYYDE